MADTAMESNVQNNDLLDIEPARKRLRELEESTKAAREALHEIEKQVKNNKAYDKRRAIYEALKKKLDNTLEDPLYTPAKHSLLVCGITITTSVGPLVDDSMGIKFVLEFNKDQTNIVVVAEWLDVGVNDDGQVVSVYSDEEDFNTEHGCFIIVDHTRLNNLAACDPDVWHNKIAALGYDGILDNAPVLTEFVLSVMSRVLPNHIFHTFYHSMFDTITINRDGEPKLYYSKFGGYMPVSFPIITQDTMKK